MASLSGHSPDLFSSRLPEKVQKILFAKNIMSIEKVMKAAFMDLVSYGLTPQEVKLLKTTVALEFQCTSLMTVNETSALLSRKWQHITFGCRALDGITRNGLPIRGITEIVGESGSGKSQICLQMSLNVQLPMAMGGLQKSAVYICTEDAFPSKRLLQMTRFYSQKYQRNDWMDNIFIEHIPDSEELFNCISKRLPNLMMQREIGLIVIDSVAGVYRLEADAITRADKMRRVVYKLQALADEHESAVICVNQVTASMNANTSDKFVPSLGLAWTNLVTTQFKISKLNKHIPNSTSIKVRRFEIGFSPELARSGAEFIITSEGICDIS